MPAAWPEVAPKGPRPGKSRTMSWVRPMRISPPNAVIRVSRGVRGPKPGSTP